MTPPRWVLFRLFIAGQSGVPACSVSCSARIKLYAARLFKLFESKVLTEGVCVAPDGARISAKRLFPTWHATNTAELS